jgi:hypothetical protein
MDNNAVAAVDRRQVVLGLIAFAVASGCGGSSKSSAPTTTGGQSGSASSSAASTTSAPASSSAPESTVPADQRIPDDVVASDADGYNGTWSATFQHADGTTGPLSVVVAIDPPVRHATLTINIGAGFFGAGSAAMSEVKDYNIDELAWDQQLYSGTSTLFGTGTIQRPDIGSGKIEIKGTQLPGRPDVASIDITTTRLNFVEPHPFSYTIVKKDGASITGTATFNK